jgi:hypothetical protein
MTDQYKTILDDELCEDCKHRTMNFCAKIGDRKITVNQKDGHPDYHCDKKWTIATTPEPVEKPRVDFNSLKICIAALKQNCRDTDKCENCLLIGRNIPHMFDENVLSPKGGVEPSDVCPFNYMTEVPPQDWDISKKPDEIFPDYLAELAMMCSPIE